ncbi:hypothetical protein MYX78_01870 [Acidobacteria bacterium AH-259-G07]|nr:hypothetical protein [Acidobacteria bacterium AH-259-G07]
MSEVTGAEKEVLRIVRQLWAVDAEKIAAARGISVSYVRDLCRSLIEKKFLTGSPAEYRLTSKASKMAAESSGGKVYNREKMEPVTEEGEFPEAKRVHAIGERIGEIKHKANLPSPEEVEAALKSNPQKTYEQVEAELSAHTLTCPAKGKEVSWHFCSSCPHQKGIDFKGWAVQCHYEFAEEELPIKTQDLFSFVSCPLVKRDLSIPECERCRYHRAVVGEANPLNTRAEGSIICGFPHTIEFKAEEASELEYRGKKMRIVPMRWE